MLENLYNFYSNDLTFTGRVIKKTKWHLLANLLGYYILIIWSYFQSVYFFVIKNTFCTIGSSIIFLYSFLAGVYFGRRFYYETIKKNHSKVRVSIPQKWYQLYSWNRDDFNKMINDDFKHYIKTNYKESNLAILKESLIRNLEIEKTNFWLPLTAFSALALVILNVLLDKLFDLIKEAKSENFFYLFSFTIASLFIMIAFWGIPCFISTREIFFPKYQRLNNIIKLLEEYLISKNDSSTEERKQYRSKASE